LSCDLKKIKFLGETNVEKIIATLEELKPALLVVDSIQTVYSLFAETEAGGLTQVRVSTLRFLEMAKKTDTTIVLVGHITKDGTAAGPKTLEHIVDAVLYLETDKSGQYRILRAQKNRFGSIDEVGIFEMTGAGLKEVADPSAVFISPAAEKQPGSATGAVIEGTRPFLVEIQALVSKTAFGYPVRKASGFDANRLQVLCAVLSKRGGVNLLNQDVILNVVGGLKLNDPALDLAVCLAIVSSLTNLPVPAGTIVLGEVGLGGEVRGLAKLKERVNEAAKLGYKTAVVPDVEMSGAKISLKKVKNVGDIVEILKS
jgi:DNA repair protein RadA/Sms